MNTQMTAEGKWMKIPNQVPDSYYNVMVSVWLASSLVQINGKKWKTNKYYKEKYGEPTDVYQSKTVPFTLSPKNVLIDNKFKVLLIETKKKLTFYITYW